MVEAVVEAIDLTVPLLLTPPLLAIPNALPGLEPRGSIEAGARNVGAIIGRGTVIVGAKLGSGEAARGAFMSEAAFRGLIAATG